MTVPGQNTPAIRNLINAAEEGTVQVTLRAIYTALYNLEQAEVARDPTFTPILQQPWNGTGGSIPGNWGHKARASACLDYIARNDTSPMPWETSGG